jgi:hypothetical protein
MTDANNLYTIYLTEEQTFYEKQLLSIDNPRYTCEEPPHEPREQILHNIINLCGTQEKKIPENLYLCAWSSFLLYSNMSNEEEKRYGLSQAEYKIREAINMCETSAKYSVIIRLHIDLKYLLGRISLELERMDTGQQQPQQIEKMFQEMCLQFDAALTEISKVEKIADKLRSSLPDDLVLQIKGKKALTLFNFAEALQLWSRQRKQRWQPLSEQSKEKYNLCLKLCQENQFHKSLGDVALERSGVLLLDWVNRTREISSIYSESSDDRRATIGSGSKITIDHLCKQCVSTWESICRDSELNHEHFFRYATSLFEYAMIITSSMSLLPDHRNGIYIQSTSQHDTAFRMRMLKDKTITFINKEQRNSPNTQRHAALSDETLVIEREEILEKALAVITMALGLLPDQMTYMMLKASILFETGAVRAVHPDYNNDCDSCFQQAMDIIEPIMKQYPVADNMSAEIYLYWGRSKNGIEADLLFRKTLQILDQKPSTIPKIPTSMDIYSINDELEQLMELTKQVRNENVICESFAVKQGGIRKNWLQRHFVLTLEHLRYFDKSVKKGEVATSTITGCIVNNTFARDEHPHGLEILTTKRSFYICFQSEDLIARWVKAIQYVVDNK